jgi:WhiB family transcriptional regulator, redox-sensing transcriptional regulator
MTARATWRDKAACHDADPELFFPIGTTGPGLVQIGEAKRICRACPAQAPCLAWALENGVADGIWGGTTHDERRAIRALLVTRPSAAKITTPGRSEEMKIRGQDKTAQPPAAITVTLDGDLLSADQMRLAQSLAESLIEETTGMRPQVSQDGDEVTFTPSRIEPR